LVFDWTVAIWIIAGAYLHWFGIEPDLDLHGISRAEAQWTRWIVPIPLIGWSTLYARIFRDFGSHRGVWTHGLFISTFIRLMYFGFPFLWLYRNYFGYEHDLIREFAGMYIGLSISDALHILADAGTGEMNFGGRNRIEFIGRFIKRKFDFPKTKKVSRNKRIT